MYIIKGKRTIFFTPGGGGLEREKKYNKRGNPYGNNREFTNRDQMPSISVALC